MYEGNTGRKHQEIGDVKIRKSPFFITKKMQTRKPPSLMDLFCVVKDVKLQT